MRASSFPAFFLFFLPPLSFSSFFLSLFSSVFQPSDQSVSRANDTRIPGSRAYARDVLSACSAPLEKLPGPSNSASLRRNRENQFTGDSRQAGLIGTVTGKSDTHWVAFFVRKRIGHSLSLSPDFRRRRRRRRRRIAATSVTGAEKFRPRRIGASVAARDTKVAPLLSTRFFTRGFRTLVAEKASRKPRLKAFRSRGNAQLALPSVGHDLRNRPLHRPQRSNWPGERPWIVFSVTRKDRKIKLWNCTLSSLWLWSRLFHNRRD